VKLGKSASEVMRDMMLDKLADLEGMAAPERQQETQLNTLDLQAKNEGLTREPDKLRSILEEHGVWDGLTDVVLDEYKLDFKKGGRPGGNAREVIAEMLHDYPNLKGLSKKDFVSPSLFQILIHYIELRIEQHQALAKLGELQHVNYAKFTPEAHNPSYINYTTDAIWQFHARVMSSKTGTPLFSMGKAFLSRD
jgi:hypothetical protein